MTQSETVAPLVVELYGLVNNTVRLKVNELNPMKPRYEIPVGDVLVEEPKLQRFVKLFLDSSLCLMRVFYVLTLRLNFQFCFLGF